MAQQEEWEAWVVWEEWEVWVEWEEWIIDDLYP